MTDDIKDRAEAHFKKEERASEAMTEYKATVDAERAKTERLRALRLAKEAAGVMTHEGIEFVIRTGLGRSEWAVTIHFPDASDALARSSVVKVTGTRGEAIALAHDRICNWLKRQRKTSAST